VNDKPSWVRGAPQLSSDEIAQIDDRHRKRLQVLLSVDDMISDLVEALDAGRELENTYIVFTSDNGWHQGEHRLSEGKFTPYEESIRVPLVVRGPDVPAGRTVKQ
jgi:N-acetylglucosamine-6-sulfatase